MTAAPTIQASVRKETYQESVEVIKNAAKTAKGSAAADKVKVNDKTKVNEQELFASIIYRELSGKSKNLAKRFADNFQQEYAAASLNKETFPAVRAARRALSQVVQDGKTLSKEDSKTIRQYAIGKSQLDDKRDNLLTGENKGSKASVMEFAEARSKVIKNEGLSEEEHLEFKATMKSLMNPVKDLGKVKEASKDSEIDGGKLFPTKEKEKTQDAKIDNIN